MGLLTPEKLESLVAAGCGACGGKRLVFAAYVDARLPLMEGEPVGKLAWAYDGEAFCDGVYAVTCAACKASVFATDVCPRCHAPGALERALESENAWPVPAQCPRCENTQTIYTAMVPATAVHEGKRAEKARADAGLYDPGFHGWKAACKQCGDFAELTERCMLCDAPAPLRPRA
jgi:hypothetical protein